MRGKGGGRADPEGYAVANNLALELGDELAIGEFVDLASDLVSGVAIGDAIDLFIKRQDRRNIFGLCIADDEFGT